MKIVPRLSALRTDRKAVTALEYGLIAAAVATTIVAAFLTFDTSLKAVFTGLAGHLSLS